MNYSFQILKHCKLLDNHVTHRVLYNFSINKKISIYILISSSARGCNTANQCFGNEVCVRNMCQPRQCNFNGQCAFGSNCIGGQCSGKQPDFEIGLDHGKGPCKTSPKCSSDLFQY